jgi:glutamate-ammonia-ligase adenylyltransferase
LVVSIASFAGYQRRDAWTWEHMALTRARPIFGSVEARQAVAAVIADVLNGNRPERDVVAEAGDMRAEMARHKPPQGPLDVKLVPGGLVDLEFAVHRTQLAHRAGFDPDLGRAIAALVGQGLMPPGMARAHDVLTRALVAFRLLVPDGQEPPEPTRPLIARAMGLPDWDAVVATLEATRQEVSQVWQGG